MENPVPLIFKNPGQYKYHGKGIKIQYPAYLADERYNEDGSTTVSIVIFPFKYSEKERTLYILDSLTFYFDMNSKRDFSRKHTKGSSPLYLIIAEDSILQGFSKLALWKRQKGYKVKMLSTESINATFPGRDGAEKLRNALKLYYTDSNLVYVLLGGDVNSVPARVAYAMTCEAHFANDEDSIRADLYFSDLDGTWDDNNNGIFGEVSDSIDLYPDVYVGRVPADNVEEAVNFSEKLIRYEQNPLPETSNALFFAMVLWEDPYTNSGLSKDFIDTTFLPDYYNVTKLYEVYGNETRASVIQSLENGNGIMNHNGHGWWTGMWLNGSPNWEHLDNTDADTVHMVFGGVLYSIGCWVGAFDKEDAISEHFILNPYGPVAFVANSRYGWGSPGNPLYGYSDKLDQNFYRKIFNDSIFHVGIALAEDKADFVPLSRWENVYRWHQYEVNLLGDPEMEIHTEYLGPVLSDIPDTVVQGSSLTFTVYDQYGNLLSDAKVALSYDDSVYATTASSKNGSGTIDIPLIGMDSIYLTIYARNHVTLKKWIHVLNGLVIEKIELTGSQGAYYPFPGDSGDIKLYFKNKGSTPLSDIPVLFHTININLIQDSVIISDTIYQDSTYVISLPFVIPENITENDTVSISVHTPDVSRKFVFIIKKPHMLISVDGNDSITVPEDTLSILITNNFFSPLKNLNIHIYCTLGNVSIPNDSLYIAEVQPYSSQRILIPVQIMDTGVFQIGLRIFNNEYLDDTFFVLFSTENTDYLFDFESPLDGFYYTGNWQRTTQRAYSGTYSIWDGVDNHYENNVNDTLITPWIHTEYSPTLSFFMWYNAATYGQDGVHVFYLNKNGTWNELDYIGSGGALGDKTKGFTTGWSNYTYNLSGLSYGDSTRIMFVLVTDSTDTAEGFYIDQIIVSSRNYMGVDTSPSYSLPVSLPTVVSNLLPLAFNLDSPPEIHLLDIQGREILRLRAIESHGKVIINIENIKPGLYFVNVRTLKTNYVKRVVIQR